jgi:hypothetical protein
MIFEMTRDYAIIVPLRHDRYPHAHSDHHATYALDRMRHESLDALAVVSRADVHELQGVV